MLANYILVLLLSSIALFAMEKEAEQTIQTVGSYYQNQFLAMRKIQKNILEYVQLHKNDPTLKLKALCNHFTLPIYNAAGTRTEQGLLLKLVTTFSLVKSNAGYHYYLITPWGILNLLKTKDKSRPTKQELFPTATFAASPIGNFSIHSDYPIISIDEIITMDGIELPTDINIKEYTSCVTEEEYALSQEEILARTETLDKLVATLDPIR